LNVRTMKYDVWTVEPMHAISIHKAWASEPWILSSGWLNFVCTTCLIKDSVWTRTHIVRTVVAVFPYLCFGKKSFYLSNIEGVWACCWDVQTNATKNSSKLLETEGDPNRKFSSSRRIILGQLSVRTEYHVVRTDAKDLISLTWNLSRIF